MEGLYREAGSDVVFYVSGSTKRPIFDSTTLVQLFGADAPGRVQALPAGALSPYTLSGGGLFGGIFDTLGIKGGGTLHFGNQAIAGNLWVWVIAAVAVVVYILTRRR